MTIDEFKVFSEFGSVGFVCCGGIGLQEDEESLLLQLKAEVGGF